MEPVRRHTALTISAACAHARLQCGFGSASAWAGIAARPWGGKTDDQMSNIDIRYDLLVQDALRDVVRKVMTDAARDGLPGDHHFSITFRTGAPGVRVSSRTREKYPGEMTIILQHQFWDLEVTEKAFEVGLSFGGVSERLFIPFDAITAFFDPSVQFGLKFEVQEVPDQGANDTVAPAKAGRPTASVPSVAAKSDDGKVVTAKPPGRNSRVDAAKSENDSTGKSEADKDVRGKETAEKEMADKDAKVVSIDAFRKKP
jgi:hypothetical protein